MFYIPHKKIRLSQIEIINYSTSWQLLKRFSEKLEMELFPSCFPSILQHDSYSQFLKRGLIEAQSKGSQERKPADFSMSRRRNYNKQNLQIASFPLCHVLQQFRPILQETPEPLSLSTCQTNPYQMRVMRKIIDQVRITYKYHRIW